MENPPTGLTTSICPAQQGGAELISLVTVVEYAYRVETNLDDLWSNTQESSMAQADLSQLISSLILESVSGPLCGIPCILSLSQHPQEGDRFTSCTESSSSSQANCFEHPNTLHLRHSDDCSEEELQRVTAATLDVAVGLSGFTTTVQESFPAVTRVSGLGSEDKDEQPSSFTSTSSSRQEQLTTSGIIMVVFTGVALLMALVLLLTWWRDKRTFSSGGKTNRATGLKKTKKGSSKVPHDVDEESYLEANLLRDIKSDNAVKEEHSSLCCTEEGDGSSLSSKSILEELQQMSENELGWRTLRVNSLSTATSSTPDFPDDEVSLVEVDRNARGKQHVRIVGVVKDGRPGFIYEEDDDDDDDDTPLPKQATLIQRSENRDYIHGLALEPEDDVPIDERDADFHDVDDQAELYSSQQVEFVRNASDTWERPRGNWDKARSIAL